MTFDFFDSSTVINDAYLPSTSVGFFIGSTSQIDDKAGNVINYSNSVGFIMPIH